MARPRVIDQEAVLDAAEIVVGREGAANMTLDAVAAEAGISKASVIYDYGSKQSLIKAVIERRVRLEMSKIRDAVDRLHGTANAEIRGRIEAAATPDSRASQAVAFNLCSAMAQDQELGVSLQSFYRGQIDAVVHDAVDPRQAMVAFLAVEGLKILECFGFFRWTEEGRHALLSDITALVERGSVPREDGS